MVETTCLVLVRTGGANCGSRRLEPHRSPETIEPLLELHLFLKKKNEKEGEKEESKRKKEEIQPP